MDLSLRRELGLKHTIEAEIIPRLMLAHRGVAIRQPGNPANPSTINAEDIRLFSAIICSMEVAPARAFVGTLRERNVPVETILLDLLAPTAKLLGEMWEEDDADFTLVTVALCSLQQVLRDLSGTIESEVAVPKPGYRALLAPVPGEQHIFSVLMVDEFFRRADWDVWTMPAATEEELLDLVSRESFDMAGLSISCEAWLPKLESLIPRMRAVSANRDLVILVGGKPLTDHPELTERLGADATAADGRSAVNVAVAAVDHKSQSKSSHTPHPSLTA